MTDDFETSHALFSGLNNGLSVLGFRTVTDLLNGRPGLGYLKVADELKKAIGYGDVSLSAAALRHRHLKEALLRGEFRDALADSFFRCFQDVGRMRRGGWNNTPDPTDHVSIDVAWAPHAMGAARDCGYDVEVEINHVWKLIESAPPPKGWIPQSGDDPIIKNAIEVAFRDSSVK